MSFALVQVIASFLKKDEVLNEDDFNFEITYPHWEDIVEDVKEQENENEILFDDEPKIKVKLLKDCIGFDFKIIGDGFGVYDTGIAYGNRTTSLDIHSYDPKFASHIFRLINEGCELLETGKLNFPCSNAEFQKDIKLGKYDLDYLLQKVEEIEQQIENAYLNSNIQYAPQYDKINELQIKLLLEWWKERQYI